jgi:acyl carrier protein
MNNINQQTSRVVTLSPMQRAASQLDYDINKIRTLIAEYLAIETSISIINSISSSQSRPRSSLKCASSVTRLNQFAGVEISETQIEAVGDLIRHIESQIDLNQRAL